MSAVTEFQSTHPSRGATEVAGKIGDMTDVSIHAPLAGCDPRLPVVGNRERVSIHAPLAGCDRSPAARKCSRSRFNPRTPRGVRLYGNGQKAERRSFNPRTPRGVRQSRDDRCRGAGWFQSTHPSRGATTSSWSMNWIMTFQSTHPSRGATFPYFGDDTDYLVSIHAPLAGCDLPLNDNTFGEIAFQSTHPSRGATANGPTKGTFCHVFMGVTRHKYDFSRRFVPRPSFGTVLPPIFYHAIFCSLHLRAHKEPLR